MKQLALTLFAILLVSASGGHSRADDAPGDAPKRAEIRRQDGGRLAYYHWAGSGPSLLLIPGSWSDYRQFDRVRENLDPNLNLVIVELPGHGRSWPPTLAGSIESFAEEILCVVDVLGWKSWYAGGHSIGGMIAIELAGRRPEQVAGAISIEGWSHHRVLNDAFGGRVYNTLSGEREKERQEARARGLGRLTKKQIDAFRTIWKRWDGEPILRSTPVRVLEMWGDRKRPLPARGAMRIPERNTIELRGFAGNSHALPLERPKEVAAAINRFIEAAKPHPRRNPASPLMPHLECGPAGFERCLR